MKFKGITYLTEEQYAKLVEDGTLTVGDTTITYEAARLYVTPETTQGEYASQQDLVELALRVDNILTQLSLINTSLINLLGV